MSTVQRFMLEASIDSPEAAQMISVSAKELSDGRKTLIDIVQSVGEYINHEDASIRSQALEYVTKVLCELPENFLSRQQLSVLIDFFCARMKDGGAIKALDYLQSLPRCNKDMAIVITETIPRHFADMRPLVQAQRYEVYSLLHSLMRNHRDALKTISSKVLKATMDMFSGEKDPRNLMLVFSLLHAMMVEWDISAHAEELFDSVFCYFPITFKPPSSDPYKITANALKERLRDCIASNSSLAPFAFPQLIDKLDSTSANIKRDVLQTINACVKRCDEKTLAEYSLTLWDCLKFEIIVRPDEEVADNSLDVLSSMCIVLQSEGQIHNARDSLRDFISMITTESQQYLKEPGYRNGPGIAKILHTLGSTSEQVFELIVKNNMPFLVEMYTTSHVSADRRKILEIFSRILAAGLSLQKLEKSNASITGIILDSFRTRVFQTLVQALTTDNDEDLSFQLVALRCLQQCCLLRQFLTEGELRLAIRHLNQLLLDRNGVDHKSLGKAAVGVLQDISKVRFEILLEDTVPFLMARIMPQDMISYEDSLLALESLARIAQEKNIRETVVHRLFTRLERSGFEDTDDRYIRAILLALRYVLGHTQCVEESLAFSIFPKNIAIIRQIVSKVKSGAGKTPLFRLENCKILSVITGMILNAMNVEHQREVANNVYQLYQTEAPFVCQNWQLSNDIAGRQTILFSTSFAAGISRKIGLPIPARQLPGLINRILEIASKETNPSIRHGLFHHCCLITNKFLPEAEIHHIGMTRWLLSGSVATTDIFIRGQIAGIFWIAKALLLRSLQIEAIVGSLLSLLNDPVVGSEAARGFTMLLANDEIIRKENGAVIRLLSKQKVLSSAIPNLAKALYVASENSKPNFLVAFTGLMRALGQNIAWIDIEVMLPLLLLNLKMGDSDGRMAALDIFQFIMIQPPQSLSGHTENLIACFDYLLNRTVHPNVKLRITALEALARLSSVVSKNDVSLYHRKVMYLVSSMLDDRRRLVRKGAVDCQNAWLKAEQDNGDEM